MKSIFLLILINTTFINASQKTGRKKFLNLGNLSKWVKNKESLNMIKVFSRHGNLTMHKLSKAVCNMISNSVNFQDLLSPFLKL